MKKRAHSFMVILSLILLAFIILEACSKQPITAQKTNNAVAVSGSDLKRYSLTARELPDLDIFFESNLGKNEMSPNAVSGYAASFSNNAINASSSNYRSVSINLQAYNSAEDVKKDFSTNILSKEILKNFQEIKTNGNIGDESSAYSGNIKGQRRVYVVYRANNVAVRLSSVGIGTNSTIRYARLVESKLKK